MPNVGIPLTSPDALSKQEDYYVCLALASELIALPGDSWRYNGAYFSFSVIFHLPESQNPWKALMDRTLLL